MTEEYAESLYGTPPEGDGPQGEELVTDPGDSPSYGPLDAALEILSQAPRGGIKYTKKDSDHPVLNPTPPTDARKDLGELLLAGVFATLPKNFTDVDLVEALDNAASILWGAGYRKIVQ